MSWLLFLDIIKKIFSYISNPKVFIPILVLLGLYALYHIGYKHGISDQINTDSKVIATLNANINTLDGDITRQAKIDKETLDAANKKAAMATDLYNTSFKQNQDKFNEQVKDVTTDSVTVNNIVFHHPSETKTNISNSNSGTSDSKNSGTETTTTGCHGSGLFQDDAKFLIEYARRSAILEAGYNQCYADYQAIKNGNTLMSQPVSIQMP